MKKILVILVFLLFGIMVIGNIQIAAQENIKLDLSQAINLLLANNLEFKKANYQLENAKIETKKSEAENLLTQSSISRKQKDLSLLQGEDQYRIEKEDLLIQVVDGYLHLKLLEKDIELKEKEVEYEKKILETVNTQVKAGYKVDLDLLQQGNVYYNAVFSYQQSRLNYDQLSMSLKNTLGIDSDKKITLSTLNAPKLKEITLEEAMKKGRENSVDLELKVVETELAKMALEKNKVSNTPEIEIKELENNVAIAQLEESITSQNLDQQIETQWQNFNQSKENIELSQKSLQEAKESESVVQRQVKAGFRSENEQLSASISVLTAEHQFISSIRDYYASLLTLQRLIGTLNEGEIR